MKSIFGEKSDSVAGGGASSISTEDIPEWIMG